MDLRNTIRELYEEKQRIEEAIASLEELLVTKSDAALLKLESLQGKRRRGRKSMPADERREVSDRMKKYWAQRRARSVKAAGRG